MEPEKTNYWIWGLQRLLIVVGAAVFTLAVFLVLPLIQHIGNPLRDDLVVRAVDVVALPPPPPPPVEEPEPEKEDPPEEPPRLMEQAQPLDLSQIELALNPGFGDGLFGDFAVHLGQMGAGDGGEEMDKIFSLTELDRPPRPLFRRSPTYPQDLHRRGREGTVTVIFTVDREGRVVDPRVQQSTDPAFERPALEAVSQWKFEPGTRNGEKVQFRMRQPISFSVD